MKIAWIGTGVMGGSMMMHVYDGGHEVSAYNRSIEKAQRYAQEGVHVCTSIGECVKDVDMVFTIVGYPKDVEEVYQSIFEYAKPGCICVDMTTSSPTLAKELYETGKQKNIHVVDAPVSGGDSGAKAGTLSIMVGCEEALFETIKPVLETMGTAQWMGEAGYGQHTKACNQICVAGAVAVMSEAIHYARMHHLDEEKMLSAISKGAAGSWQLNNTAPRVLNNDFEPGFFIKHFVKDMHIVQSAMQEAQGELPVLNRICEEYEQLEKDGLGDAGTQALIKFYEKDETLK